MASRRMGIIEPAQLGFHVIKTESYGDICRIAS